MRLVSSLHTPALAAALACGTVAAAGQGAPAPAAEYPLRFATHAAPQPDSPRDTDLVLGLLVGDEARAYPLNLLWHETAHTVNDELDGTPVAVALCPLAGVGSAFTRRSGGETLQIGHVSEVRLDTLVLYDARTRSRFSLVTGEAFDGALKGRTLQRLPTLFTTWGRWKALHPGTSVYVAPDQAGYGFELDENRIRRMVQTAGGPPRRSDWILGIEGRSATAAVFVRGLVHDRAANETLGGLPFVAFLTQDLTTTVAWNRSVAGRTLTFSADGDRMVDHETGSVWDGVTGRALSGPLAGRTLTALPAITGFWHAWKSHHADTIVLGLPAE